MTQAERITALEVRVGELTESLDRNTQQLADLLALKNKGAGVFWLFSAVLGSGLIGAVITIIDWIKG